MSLHRWVKAGLISITKERGQEKQHTTNGACMKDQVEINLRDTTASDSHGHDAPEAAQLVRMLFSHVGPCLSLCVLRLVLDIFAKVGIDQVSSGGICRASGKCFFTWTHAG